MVKARALYDNHSETADELSFLRDDVLEIIEKDYDGMEGWWLCGLRGKTGIAPANRLVIITVSDASGDYDMPPTRYGSFPTGKKPLVPNRDGAIEDYDTPSNRYNVALKKTAQPVKDTSPKSKTSFDDKSEYDDYCEPSNGDPPSPSDPSKGVPSGEQSATFEKYFSLYLKSEKDMKVVGAQVAGMMKKWYDCSDCNSRALIVKAVCVSYWKNIQAYISEAAKTISSIKRLVKADVFKSFEEVKKSGSDLESVLDHLNRFHELTAEEKAKLDFLQRLSALNANLTLHSKSLTEFFSGIERDGLPTKSEKAPVLNQVRGRQNLNLPSSRSPSGRLSYQDYDTPPSKSKNIPPLKLFSSNSNNNNAFVRNTNDPNRLDPGNGKNSSICSDPRRSFEATDYDFPKSSDASDLCTETSLDISRPSSCEFLDYDSPKPASLAKNKSAESLNSELSRYSNADDRADYDVPSSNSTKIRSSEATRARRKPEATLSSGNDILRGGSSTRLSFDGLDYDVPNSKGVAFDQSQRYLNQMSSKERNLLKYYFPFVVEELKNLSTLIGLFQEHLKTQEEKQSLKLINDVKSLASCSHKVLFIIDSILKRIQSNANLNGQLNFSCTKICEHLKNITNLVKVLSRQTPAAASSERSLATAVSDFQFHVQSVGKMVGHWK